MSSRLQRLTQGGSLLLLLAAICLSGYSSLLSQQLALARQQAVEQQKSLAQQAGLIATLQTQDAQNRVLMVAQQRLLRQQNDPYQRQYREALEQDPCAAQPKPGSVLELLRLAAGGAAVAP